jgi:septum formation protein
MQKQKRLVLASLSSRRQDLLGYLGVAFETIPSYIEEITAPNLAPEEVAIDLALKKATAVSNALLEKSSPEEKKAEAKRLVVLGADTIVVCEDSFFGKPSSQEEAREMLLRLSGRMHHVYTGVAVVYFDEAQEQTRCLSAYEKTAVYMRELSEKEISAYIETGESMDKAGAYGIQGTGGALIEKIDGCSSNVVGLPMALTVRLLRSAKIRVLGQ